MKLDMKNCVVVGASSGIGEAVARALAGNGCTVALVARRTDLLEAIAADIDRVAGRRLAYVYGGDVTDFDRAEPLIERIAQDLGGLDLVIYSSGVMPSVAIDEYDIDKDKLMIDVNVIGAMAWLNAAAKRFARTGDACIVGISSIAGDRGRASNPGYITSKAALDTYLECLRNRLARKGVQVTTIKPGYVRTDLIKGTKTALPVIEPHEAARQILQAIEDGAMVRYVPGWWRWVGLVVKAMPSFVMQRVNF